MELYCINQSRIQILQTVYLTNIEKLSCSVTCSHYKSVFDALHRGFGEVWQLGATSYEEYTRNASSSFTSLTTRMSVPLLATRFNFPYKNCMESVNTSVSSSIFYSSSFTDLECTRASSSSRTDILLKCICYFDFLVEKTDMTQTYFDLCKIVILLYSTISNII